MSGNDVQADQLDSPTLLGRVVDHLIGTYGSEFVEVLRSGPSGVGLLLSGEPAELRCTGVGDNRSIAVQVGTYPAVEIVPVGPLEEVLAQVRESVLLPPTAAQSTDLFVISDDGDAEVLYRLPAADVEATNQRGESTVISIEKARTDLVQLRDELIDVGYKVDLEDDRLHGVVLKVGLPGSEAVRMTVWCEQHSGRAVFRYGHPIQTPPLGEVDQLVDVVEAVKVAFGSA